MQTKFPNENIIAKVVVSPSKNDINDANERNHPYIIFNFRIPIPAHIQNPYNRC
jgi:hypothetical protein